MKNGVFQADDRLNRINDRDELWGPLLFLRPERHQLMSARRVLAVSAILGGFYGMLGNVVLSLLVRYNGSGGKPSVLLMPAVLTAIYFLSSQLSIVAAWNRRARLLSRRLDWAELTRRPLAPARDDEQEAEE